MTTILITVSLLETEDIIKGIEANLTPEDETGTS
jgi:hypothetical protein